MPICAELEAEISALTNDEKIEFLKELGLQESGLDRLSNAGYKLLGLQTYFTAGEKEVRAWTINIGDSAPKAAGKIHTDLARGFIKGDVVSYENYMNCHNFNECKSKGFAKMVDRDYIVQPNEIIEIRFNV